MLQTLYEAEPDRIGDVRHHDGDRRRCLLQRVDNGGGWRNQDIYPGLHKLFGNSWEKFELSLCKARLDEDTAALDKTHIAQAFAECLMERPYYRLGSDPDDADTRDACGLLSVRWKRT